MSRGDALEVHLGMGSLPPCSALAFAVLFACAQQHEGTTLQGDPAPSEASSETDDSAADDDTSDASSTNPSSPHETSSSTAGASDDAPSPAPIVPAWPPVPGVTPGLATATPQVCERKTFDSRAPPDFIRLTEPCSYWMASWPQVGSPKYVRVMIDGKTVPLGQPEYGWKVADDNHGITLLGAACEAAQAGASIAITRECQHPILI